MFSKYYQFIVSFLILLFIPIWIFWVAPILKKIPSHFSYSADILSLDNFYNEKLKKYEGEHISKTNFQYETINKKADYLTIKNSFSVSKLSDFPIFSASRLYYINPYTGQHVSGIDNTFRTGYLFAPRYVNKKGFTYWHVNYDAPAQLKFADVETIDGLRVYHYIAQYQADQTKDLGNLPGVPTQRGIKTDIFLQLWIEPVSGWLIKYQDNTLANFYDRTTGKMIAPWNQFSNRYTHNSIHDQVNIATQLKYKILFIDFVIPIVLFFISIILFLIPFFKKYFQYRKKTHLSKIIVKLRNGTPYFLLIILLISLSFSIYSLYYQKHRITHYVIGISEWRNTPDHLKIIQGFKDGLAEAGFVEGKNIRFIIKNPDSKIENQINIIQSFINQKVNLIYTLTTPGTLIAKGITKTTPIVFSDVTYPEESDIIDINQPNNLVGTQNHIAAPVQFYHFERLYPNTKTLAFIHRMGDPDSEIQLKEYKHMLDKRNIKIVDIAAIDLDDLKNQLQKDHSFDALFLASDALSQAGGTEIIADFSLKNKIPGFSCDRIGVIKGLLVGYTVDQYAMGKIAGKKASFLLKGAAPSWLYTVAPLKGSLIINQNSAKQLGIHIPADLLHE